MFKVKFAENFLGESFEYYECEDCGFRTFEFKLETDKCRQCIKDHHREEYEAGIL